jgi:hypothetical protein
MIVLSSDTAVKDLLDKRSGNYSDRPDMHLGQTVASGGLRLVLMVAITFPRFIDNQSSTNTLARNTARLGE